MCRGIYMATHYHKRGLFFLAMLNKIYVFILYWCHLKTIMYKHDFPFYMKFLSRNPLWISESRGLSEIEYRLNYIKQSSD